MSRFRILHAGRWERGAIAARRVESSHRPPDEVRRMIEDTWAREQARLGEKLFDGPMCRLERISVSATRIDLELSRTSYRPFLGTNLHHAELADQFGADALANAVGLSTVLQASDGWLLLGRRNADVAYYPQRVHPFAGAMEPREDLDLFADVRRELVEELSFSGDDIERIVCIGVVEDLSLRQAEFVFHVKSRPTRRSLEARLDAKEHLGVYAVKLARSAIEAAIADDLLTPVAAASLALFLQSM